MEIVGRTPKQNSGNMADVVHQQMEMTPYSSKKRPPMRRPCSTSTMDTSAAKNKTPMTKTPTASSSALRRKSGLSRRRSAVIRQRRAQQDGGGQRQQQQTPQRGTQHRQQPRGSTQRVAVKRKNSQPENGGEKGGRSAAKEETRNGRIEGDGKGRTGEQQMQLEAMKQPKAILTNKQLQGRVAELEKVLARETAAHQMTMGELAKKSKEIVELERMNGDLVNQLEQMSSSKLAK